MRVRNPRCIGSVNHKCFFPENIWLQLEDKNLCSGQDKILSKAKEKFLQSLLPTETKVHQVLHESLGEPNIDRLTQK